MAIMPPTREYHPALDSTTQSKIEFDLLDLLVVLAERKSTVLIATAIGFLLALILVMLVHPSYTAKTVIMPPQQGQSSAALISSLGSLASLTGLSTGGLKDPNDLYLALLASDRVDDAVIKRLDLMKDYKTNKITEARGILTKNSKFVSEKGGMISITVKAGDPRRAAQIANTFVDELHTINNDLVVGEAGIRRSFFTQQLALEKDRLTDAEIALRQTQEKTGAVSPTGQTSIVISQMASLQSQIISREAQLDSMRTSSTEQHPDVVRLSGEIQSLRDQLRRMQAGEKAPTPGDILLTPRVLAADQMEIVRKQREVQYHTLIFDLIARQFEAARLDEAKAAPVIEVLDPAEPPLRKSSPFRALWCLIGAILGFIYGMVRVISSYVFSRVNADEAYAEKIGQFRRALRFRHS